MDTSLDHIQLLRISQCLRSLQPNHPVIDFIETIHLLTGVDVIPCLPKDKIFLHKYEKKITSQFGEDGVIEKIFETIGTTDKFYLEFGATNRDDNTIQLRDAKGFTGVWWGDVNNVYVTVENIGDLCKEYKIPKEFDFLSIDIDGNDWYIWKEITKHTRPRVVCIEYNGCHHPDDDKIIVYKDDFKWDHKTRYFGATLKAMFNLGRKLGYNLIYCNNQGNNAFFLRDDIDCSMFVCVNDYKTLYRSLKARGDNLSGYFDKEDSSRVWLSSKDLL